MNNSGANTRTASHLPGWSVPVKSLSVLEREHEDIYLHK